MDLSHFSIHAFAVFAVTVGVRIKLREAMLPAVRKFDWVARSVHPRWKKVSHRLTESKDCMKRIRFILLTAVACWLGVTAARAAEINPPAPAGQRIGTYDSRVVAYAHFWTDAHQQKLKEQMASARAAKAAGDTARFNELSAALKKEQERNHRQVFSTAPVDEILESLKARLPEIQKQAGVSRLVSKWDEKALEQFKRAEKVEVTDLLLGEFKLTDKQKKIAESFKKSKPISPEKCEELLRKGEL